MQKKQQIFPPGVLPQGDSGRQAGLVIHGNMGKHGGCGFLFFFEQGGLEGKLNSGWLASFLLF